VYKRQIWALSGPFEHHITGCIALAAWQYYSVTRDKLWLRQKGWPILQQTALFWASRVTKSSSNVYEILNVVGADEWAENIDNDAWTNGVAKANLRNASKAAAALEMESDPLWETIADGLKIEKFEDGTTREHKQYQGEPIKQADANLLAYPLQEITEKEAVLADLAYYQSKVPDIGTPAMTKSIFALLYARMGETEKAYQTFLNGYRPNTWGPFRAIMETSGSYNPYFSTAAGGILQAVIMGFGGLSIEDDGIKKIEVPLPKKWKALQLIRIGPQDKTITIRK